MMVSGERLRSICEAGLHNCKEVYIMQHPASDSFAGGGALRERLCCANQRRSAESDSPKTILMIFILTSPSQKRIISLWKVPTLL